MLIVSISNVSEKSTTMVSVQTVPQSTHMSIGAPGNTSSVDEEWINLTWLQLIILTLIFVILPHILARSVKKFLGRPN